MAIKNDGTLWSWGSDYNGELGTYTGFNVPLPMQEYTSDSKWVFIGIGAGEQHSVGIKNDGTLWAWGSNKNGELGTK